MQDIPSVPFKSHQHIPKYTASASYAEQVDGFTVTNIIQLLTGFEDNSNFV